MLQVRPVAEQDRGWMEDLLREHWGSPMQVTRGNLQDASKLPGFVALYDEERAGLITYRIVSTSCEIVTLNSLIEGKRIGTALVEAVRQEAAEAGCTRLWLITTNDNVNALRFWQKRGLSLVCVHRNMIEHARRLKPEIPLIGQHGIEIRDEIEMEIRLS